MARSGEHGAVLRYHERSTVGGAVDDARLATLPTYGDDVQDRPRLVADRGPGGA